MKPKILFVDDDPDVLAGFSIQLSDSFNIHTALGGEQGLCAIRDGGPFEVIVSDLRMPGMDGIEFLAEAAKLAPDTVLVMLTCQGDAEAAHRAVKEGRVSRFLTKPCSRDSLTRALNTCVIYFRKTRGRRIHVCRPHWAAKR